MVALGNERIPLGDAGPGMRGPLAIAGILASALACAAPSTYSTGTGGPVPWTPGRYALEAVIGNGITDQEFRAVLTITPDGSMSLASSTGLCVDPTPAAADRDRASGQRTFECGEAVYRVRPTPNSVRGEIIASILEEYEDRIPCASASDAQRTCPIMRTRRVTRDANLTVSSLN
jgi:hypothetical protein